MGRRGGRRLRSKFRISDGRWVSYRDDWRGGGGSVRQDGLDGRLDLLDIQETIVQS